MRAVSFRILVHAEIEAFLEERAYELFDEAWQAWSTYRVPSRVLAGLLAFSGHSMPQPPSRLGAKGKRDFDDVDGMLARVKNYWKDQVYKRNNGIKEANVLGVLLPLGIDGNDIDNTMLADLTSFGGRRGAVVHSSSVGVTKYADPKSEFDQSQQLVRALVNIDDLVTAALEEIAKTKKALGH